MRHVRHRDDVGVGEADALHGLTHRAGGDRPLRAEERDLDLGAALEVRPELGPGVDEGDHGEDEQHAAESDEVPALPHEVELAAGLDEFHVRSLVLLECLDAPTAAAVEAWSEPSGVPPRLLLKAVSKPASRALPAS